MHFSIFFCVYFFSWFLILFIILLLIIFSSFRFFFLFFFFVYLPFSSGGGKSISQDSLRSRNAISRARTRAFVAPAPLPQVRFSTITRQFLFILYFLLLFFLLSGCHLSLFFSVLFYIFLLFSTKSIDFLFVGTFFYVFANFFLLFNRSNSVGRPCKAKSRGRGLPPRSSNWVGSSPAGEGPSPLPRVLSPSLKE